MKIDCRDVTYHVKVVGFGEPFLLLHGFTGNVDTWRFLSSIVVQSLSTDYGDIIGHGKTEVSVDIRALSNRADG